MQTALQIPRRHDALLAFSLLHLVMSGGEIEFVSFFKSQTAFTKIAFVFDGIERDLHSLIVVAFEVKSNGTWQVGGSPLHWHFFPAATIEGGPQSSPRGVAGITLQSRTMK